MKTKQKKKDDWTNDFRKESKIRLFRKQKHKKDIKRANISKSMIKMRLPHISGN